MKTVTFKGMKNGRPTFDFAKDGAASDVPPKWLRELHGHGRIQGTERGVSVNGREFEIGQGFDREDVE